MRCILPVLAALILVSACGDETLDRADPDAVFQTAMRAVHDADWQALEPLLTPEARREMRRVLERLKQRLGAPETGRLERAQARAQLGARCEEEIRRVVEGGPGEALRFCTLLMPRERTPAARAGQKTATGRIVLYTTGDGTLRPVRLVLVDGRWFVADLQL